MSSSATMSVSPSEQIRKTSPSCASTVNDSTSTSGSVPTARVITERCGCVSASSGESLPLFSSSLTSEWSSVSCSRLPSRSRYALEPQPGPPDAADVAGCGLGGRCDAHAVHEGPVRRAEVAHPDAVTARLDSQMVCRCELVAFDRDVVLAAATDGERGRVERELVAGREDLAVHDDQPARCDRPAGEGRAQDEALLRQAHVAAGGADDPPDEQIEQNAER